MFITVFTRALHCPNPEPDESSPYHRKVRTSVRRTKTGKLADWDIKFLWGYWRLREPRLLFFLGWLFNDAVSIEILERRILGLSMNLEKMVKWELVAETYVFGGNLSQCHLVQHTWSDNKVRELVTVCLPWQQWTEISVWFHDVGISAFHSCVVVYLWQPLSEWRLLLSECVFVRRRENVGAGTRALSVREFLASKQITVL
jgi:hypothetical protein